MFIKNILDIKVSIAMENADIFFNLAQFAESSEAPIGEWQFYLKFSIKKKRITEFAFFNWITEFAITMLSPHFLKA